MGLLEDRKLMLTGAHGGLGHGPVDDVALRMAVADLLRIETGGLRGFRTRERSFLRPLPLWHAAFN
jgi:hypothetical protein